MCYFFVCVLVFCLVDLIMLRIVDFDMNSKSVLNPKTLWSLSVSFVLLYEGMWPLSLLRQCHLHAPQCLEDLTAGILSVELFLEQSVYQQADVTCEEVGL